MHWSLAIALSASHLLRATAAETRAGPVRCGNEDPPAELVEMAISMESSAFRLNATAANRTLEIDLYIHVVTSENKEGTVTEQMVLNQVDVLNEAYKVHNITFDLIGYDSTVDDDWATGISEKSMKDALRKGTYASLNLYALSDVYPWLGYCRFPKNTSSDSDVFIKDGCMVAAGTLPGGDIERYNEGATAIHEIGHWFGLFHVFQGHSCSGVGDSVSDTPQQGTETYGCPMKQDSCSDVGGLDSIHNYMDYSDDQCLTTFTKGQETRMYEMWDEYRAGK